MSIWGVEQVVSDDGNFHGWQPRECGEHRTVGDYRAWCYDCGEWCYSRELDMACKGCIIVGLKNRIEELEGKSLDELFGLPDPGVHEDVRDG